jgi:ribosome-binding factor A
MSIKQNRVAEQIKVILSELLIYEVSDPRLQGLTVTEVKIDRELMYANVYVNALGEEGRREEVLEGLESAKGFLRREVGKRVSLRNTPSLIFHWDTTLSRSDNILNILDTLEIPPEEDVDAE